MSKEADTAVEEVEHTGDESIDVAKIEQAAADRVRTEYSRKLKDAERANDELRSQLESAKSTDPIDGLRDEIATIRAEKRMLATQADLLQRAVDAEIDPHIAISFAGAADPGGAFDAAVAEIDRRVETKVNSIISKGTPPKAGTPPDSHDFSKLTQAELQRLPASQRDAAFIRYATAVDNDGRSVGGR